jgi:hypothetical protein
MSQAEMDKMKKGCLIFTAVVLGICLIGYFSVRSVTRRFFGAIDGFQRISKQVRQQTDQANSRYPFERPGNPEASEKQIDSYVAVRKNVNETMRGTEMAKKFEEFEAIKAQGRDPSFSDFMEIIGNAEKSAQAVFDEYFRQLEQFQMSPKEYDYIADLVTTVISIELDKGSLKKEVSSEYSLEIRQKMLDAERSNLPLFQLKKEVLALPAESYDGLIKNVLPSVIELDSLRTTTFFDQFATIFGSEKPFPNSPPAESPPDFRQKKH